MPTTVPLFPLSTVHYPGVVLPLQIFEPRYRRLVADLQAEPPGSERHFGIAAVKSGRESAADSLDQIHEIGCLAELTRAVEHEDGRYSIVVTGTQRFRILEIDTSGPYLHALVDLLDEPVGAQAQGLKTASAALFLAYQRALGALRGVKVGPTPELPDEPTILSYLIAASMVLDLADKQRLLAAPDASARLRREQMLLQRETFLIGELRSLPAIDLIRQEG
ncbi:MAG TPA: LON peptidase substrate-binding domain-containing protein [Actinocrinis sp.]|nr:LON peptidase substrate-binding domain-containing protein [Actinocrinis sp.]